MLNTCVVIYDSLMAFVPQFTAMSYRISRETPLGIPFLLTPNIGINEDTKSVFMCMNQGLTSVEVGLYLRCQLQYMKRCSYCR